MSLLISDLFKIGAIWTHKRLGVQVRTTGKTGEGFGLALITPEPGEYLHVTDYWDRDLFATTWSAANLLLDFNPDISWETRYDRIMAEAAE